MCAKTHFCTQEDVFNMGVFMASSSGIFRRKIKNLQKNVCNEGMNVSDRELMPFKLL